MRPGKHGLGVGLVVAVVAMLATAAGASAATPEFYNVNGKLPSNAKVSFTMKEEGYSRWATAGFPEMECKGSEGTGEIVGPTKIKHMVVTYHECDDTGAASSCESPEPGTGTVVTKSLEGELVYLRKSSGLPAGVLFHPESGTKFTALHCGLYSTEVTGSIIGEVPAGSINKLSLTGQIIYTASSAGKQHWRQIEQGGTEYHLTGWEEAMSISNYEAFKFAEEIEIKA